MRVWKITMDCDNGHGGYYVDDPECLEPEFEECCEITKEAIEEFTQKSKQMEVGQVLSLGCFDVTCSDIEKNELNNLLEFSGW